MWLGMTPVQGRIDGWGPDPITGFYTVDALLRGDWETLGAVAAPSGAADVHARASGRWRRSCASPAPAC